jgi:hypothetical protein
MYGQLNLEVISNLSKNERRSFSFHEFWSEEACCKRRPKKKTPKLVFECHDLVEPMELGL